MVTADALLFSINVYDKRGVIGVRDHERANGFALQIILPIVVSRVDVVANLDVRIAGRDLVVEVTLVTLLCVTQGLDYHMDFPAKAGHEIAFASQR